MMSDTSIVQAPQSASLDRRDAFEPANLDQAMQLAKHLAESGLMPKALMSPAAIVTAVIMGRELGLSAMQSVRSIHVIEGKPALSSSLIVALCKKQPGLCKYFRLVQSTDEIATYETHRVGEPEPTTMSFTIKDAQRAGVAAKDNWRKYPAAMLRARCETALARAVYPDLVMGLYDPDELENIDPNPPSHPTPIRSRTTAKTETANVTDVEATRVTDAPAAANDNKSPLKPTSGPDGITEEERDLAALFDAAKSDADRKAVLEKMKPALQKLGPGAALRLSVKNQEAITRLRKVA